VSCSPVRRVSRLLGTGLVLPDDVVALADRRELHPVGDDLDDVVVVIATQGSGYLAVQRGRVDEVQRDQREVAVGDVVGVDGSVAGPGDADAGGQSDEKARDWTMPR
jgi:hypothetical protein